ETRETRNAFRARRMSRIDFAAFGKIGDAVGGAERERFDGHRGLATAGRDKAAAIAEEKIFHIVGAMIGVDNGSLWISSHAAGAEQVHSELLLLDGIRPLLLCAGGVENLEAVFVKPFRELDVVGMILVSHSKRGKPPSIFNIWIDGKAVVFLGERSA